MSKRGPGIYFYRRFFWRNALDNLDWLERKMKFYVEIEEALGKKQVSLFL